MGSQRIASALTHLPFTSGPQDDPGLGEEGEGGEEPGFGGGNISSPEDAVIQDLTATLECLYDGSLEELDYETLTRIPSIGEDFTFDDCNGRTTADPRSIDNSCACEQSTYWAQIGGVDCSTIPIIYWYHPDYLGSIEFVTDMDGNAYQFFHNTIWGENLQNQMAYNYTAFSSRFRFNGKEWDEETGNFYYGARYYDPEISIWLSVDPLAGEAPQLTPYRFSFNNPLNVVDPNGMFEDDITVNSEGIIIKVVETDQPNRFFDEEGNQLFFNDPNNLDKGKLDRENFEVGERLFFLVTKSELLAGIQAAGKPDGWFETFTESYGKADFTYELFGPIVADDWGVSIQEDFIEKGVFLPQTMGYFRVEGEKSIYNLYDAGNFGWGAWMAMNGYSRSASLKAAGWNSLITFNGPDTKEDQRAISNGHKFYTRNYGKKNE